MKDMMDKSHRRRFAPEVRLRASRRRSISFDRAASDGASRRGGARILLTGLKGPLDLVAVVGVGAGVALASSLEGLKRMPFIEFAPCGERSNREHIFADGAIAFAGPGVGQRSRRRCRAP